MTKKDNNPQKYDEGERGASIAMILLGLLGALLLGFFVLLHWMG